MVHLVFQHRKGSRNIGDRECCPAYWLPFDAQKTVQSLTDTVPPCDLAIFGGGQIYASAVEAVTQRAAAARHCVTWAIGLQAAKRKVDGADQFQARMSLIGCRDVGIKGTEYVPCATCLAPGLQTATAPTRGAVLYLHATKSDAVERPDGIPCRTNHDGTLNEALAFIAAGETVITNSFHGTYWAMLMGRKVLCLPFSAKFRGFARMPALADPGNWRADLPRAYALPGYLDDCIAANYAFRDKVMNLI